MRNRLHPSKEHSVFEAYRLEPPPKWNFQTQIGTGGFAKVYKESITRPVFGKHICAVKRILKGDVKFPKESYKREIEIFSKLKQVSIVPSKAVLVYLLARCMQTSVYGGFGSSDLYVYDIPRL